MTTLATHKNYLAKRFPDYFVRVLELKNPLDDLDVPSLRLVANDILDATKIDASDEDKKQFQEILIAMFKSIRQETLNTIINSTDHKLLELAKTKRDAMEKIEKKNLMNDKPVIRVKARFEYYENLFVERSLIQNCCWNFAGLDSHIEDFIEENEKSKMNLHSLFMTQWKGVLCTRCNQTCAIAPSDICPCCQSKKALELFIKLSKFFKILGDMYLFFSYCPQETLDYLKSHSTLMEIFNKMPADFNVIKKYAKYWRIKKELFIDPEKRLKKDLMMMKKKRRWGQELLQEAKDDN